MEPREFVETRMRRCMAQTLQEFEEQIEQPLRDLHATLPTAGARQRVGAILASSEAVKRTFRKKLQAFAADCIDLMPADVEINAFEPIVRR
jgi:hypothetical protein